MDWNSIPPAIWGVASVIISTLLAPMLLALWNRYMDRSVNRMNLVQKYQEIATKATDEMERTKKKNDDLEVRVETLERQRIGPFRLVTEAEIITFPNPAVVRSSTTIQLIPEHKS